MPTKWNRHDRQLWKFVKLQEKFHITRKFSLFLRFNRLAKRLEMIIDPRSKMQELRALNQPKTQIALVKQTKSRANHVMLPAMKSDVNTIFGWER